MYRQRRMEAIARRRALLDTQMQMLTWNEARVPNIIRNRAGNGRRQPSHRIPNQSVIRQIDSVGVGDNPGRSETFSIVQEQKYKVPTGTEMRSGQNGCDNPPNAVYLTSINEGSGSFMSGVESAGLEGCEEIVEIALMDDTSEILKCANGQQLQTVIAEDGTVLVVLEGNDMCNKQIALGSVSSVDKNSIQTGTPQLTNLIPTKEEHNIQPEVLPVDEESYQYVIVQTADGEVLVPRDSLIFQDSTQEGSVRLVSTEGGVFKQCVGNPEFTNPSHVVRSQNQTVKNKHQMVVKTPPVVRKPKIANRIARPKVNANSYLKRTTTTFTSVTVNALIPKDVTVGNSLPSMKPKPTPVISEEKPRPFRFEFPDFDVIDEDGFMSVPVPIQIDSLRSQTRMEKP